MLATHTGTSAERPAAACVLHTPPTGTRAWVLADPGYATCEDCLKRLRKQLAEIRERYDDLDPEPAMVSDDQAGVRTPGTGSAAAANPHIVAMRDARSRTCEVSWDGTAYIGWERPAESRDGWIERQLPYGVLGPVEVGLVTKRIDAWFGSDRRPYVEAENPPQSIVLALASMAQWIAEERDVRPPRIGPTHIARWPHTRLAWYWAAKMTPYPLPPGIHGPARPPGRWLAAGQRRPRPIDTLVHWLDVQCGWLTQRNRTADRSELLIEFAGQVRATLKALYPVTGDPRIWVCRCPNTIDHGEHTSYCDANLYLPVKGDTIVCGNPHCGRRWPKTKWDGDSPDCLMRLVDIREQQEQRAGAA